MVERRCELADLVFLFDIDLVFVIALGDSISARHKCLDRLGNATGDDDAADDANQQPRGGEKFERGLQLPIGCERIVQRPLQNDIYLRCGANLEDEGHVVLITGGEVQDFARRRFRLRNL